MRRSRDGARGPQGWTRCGIVPYPRVVRVGNGGRVLIAIVAMGVATAFYGGTSGYPAGSQSGRGSGSRAGTRSGPGGTPSSSTSCRTGVATYRIVITSGAFTSTTNGSCTFNPATAEGTCTNVYTDTAGGSITSVSTTRNSSRGDVVDEVSVIPPLTLSTSTTSRILSGGTVPASGGTATRTFSGRRVLTQTNVPQPSGPTSTTTFTAWDSSDRPIAATTVTGQGSSQQLFTYDNATRTQTMTQSGVTCSQAFDLNGNPTVGTCPGQTSTTTVLTTQQICR